MNPSKTEQNGRLRIRGRVEPGFESVRQLFENQMRTMAERNVQLCAFYRGKKVVDLWASAIGDDTFTADSLVNVFSSGKSLEAIAIASLVSRGLVRYDAKITQYWPEFGANGKDGLTIADLMRHEAGLANFDTSIDMEDLFTENIKQNAVGRIIEEHAPAYREGDGGKREYHALTRGWIVNEVFRRVDPAGRTIGEFLREEVSGPLDADVVVGVKETEMPRVSKVHALGFGYVLLQSLIPRFLGRRIVHNIFQILGRLIRIVPSMIKSRRAGTPPPLTGMTGMGFFNEPGFARGETPSANATCSAGGLAKIAAMMSAGGKWEGREFISDEAWQAMHEHPVKADMGAMLVTRFTQGGVDCFTPCTAQSTRIERDFNEGREGFYGWMGLGGSIFQWHPKRDIGFAFVPTSLHVLDFLNERGKRYQAEILKCVETIER
ncbi:serine hydrolase domain-containing protein [Pseudohalioglobus lutimaris]|uniref:Esterase n=1 Tax=Pseudohalioglobus lutimaris TaxID=1737061 RepID=A0A2N5X0Z4_9GAMM|nr:serine hydrolase domain-containing protein [Pseudohalioglobus lutimaris]PLW68165.1 esterase [Pseudohalioglobus lutimaris]